MRATVIAGLLLGSLAAAAAQPAASVESPAVTVRAADSDHDGWVEWTVAGREGSYPSLGEAILAASKDHDLGRLVAEAERYPASQAVLTEIARRLWQDGRREESLEYYRRAQALENTELLQESAHRLYQQGRWGSALSQLSACGVLGYYQGCLEKDPITARLLERWSAAADGRSLALGDYRLTFEDLTPTSGAPIRMGAEQAFVDLGTGTLQIPRLGLQLKITPERMVTTLASELAGPQGLAQHLGESVQGRPIVGYRLGEGEETVLFFGAFHGDEPESTLVCNRLLEYLRKNPQLLEGRTAVIVPVVNPDGLHAGTRLNANKVDLNRNYPTSNWNDSGQGGDYWGGPGAASEPETQVVMELLQQLNPARIISIHCPYKCVNYDGPAEQLAAIISEENGYKVEPSIGYPTPGSFGTYAGIEAKIPTITLELPPTGEEDVWPDNRQALVRALRGE